MAVVVFFFLYHFKKLETANELVSGFYERVYKLLLGLTNGHWFVVSWFDWIDPGVPSNSHLSHSPRRSRVYWTIFNAKRLDIFETIKLKTFGLLATTIHFDGPEKSIFQTNTCFSFNNIQRNWFSNYEMCECIAKYNTREFFFETRLIGPLVSILIRWFNRSKVSANSSRGDKFLYIFSRFFISLTGWTNLQLEDQFNCLGRRNTNLFWSYYQCVANQSALLTKCVANQKGQSVSVFSMKRSKW